MWRLTSALSLVLVATVTFLHCGGDSGSSCGDCGDQICVQNACRAPCNTSADCALDAPVCVDGACLPAVCGNGVVEVGEACDGDCPVACDDLNACTDDVLSGTATACSAECLFTAVTACISADGCCPAGCDAGADGDCSGAPVLIAHWTLDDSVGQVAADSTGNGHNGALMNFPSSGHWIQGRVGGALSFDEVDQVVVIPDFDYGPEFTIAFWFAVPINAGSAFKYAFSHGTFDAAHNVNIFLTEEDRGNPAEMGACVKDVDDVVDCSVIGTVLYTAGVDGDWHHYALSVSDTGARSYIDGFAANSGPNGGDAINPATDIFLGARSDLAAGHFFGGGLDDVRIYDGALDIAEINAVIDFAP